MQPPGNFGARHIGQGTEQRLLVAGEHFGVFASKEIADEIGRIGQRPSEQPQEGHATARLIFTQAQQGTEKCVEDLRRFQRRPACLGFEHIEHGQALTVETVETPPKHRTEQAFLAPEMIVRRREIDPGRCRDRAH